MLDNNNNSTESFTCQLQKKNKQKTIETHYETKIAKYNFKMHSHNFHKSLVNHHIKNFKPQSEVLITSQ